MELYLVIKCGYEGIEQLFFPTASAQEAVDKITDRRKKIVAARKRREEVLAKFPPKEKVETSDDWGNEWDKMFFDRKEREKSGLPTITGEEHSMGTYDDPEAYCIQKWDNDKQEFKCVCKELNVEGGPSQTWWM